MNHLFKKKKKAIVVFSSAYQIGISTYGDHQTFDIYKYKRIKQKLIDEKKLKARDIFRPSPCTDQDILMVHDRDFISKLKDPLTVNRILKIDINSLWDNSVLEYYRAVCGGTIKACFAAYRYKIPVFNLGGGFHHAYPDKAEGFCLINDIAIAIQVLRSHRPVHNILIIDLDYHQGNGTRHIFKDNPAIFTYSLHAALWETGPAMSNLDREISSDIRDDAYLKFVYRDLENIQKVFAPEFVIFIAGSDPYEKDTLADMRLSREALLKRNMFVLDLCRDQEWPVTILPGGGYGPDSWEIYYDFIVSAFE